MANHSNLAPEWLSAKYMQDIMRTSLKKSDLIVDRIEVEPGSEIGDNFACQIFRIRVHFGNKVLPIIGKIKPKTKMLEDFDFDVFQKEALFFSDILHRLDNVEKQSVPMPYYVDYEHETIFMEDLKEKQFYMQPRNVFLNLEQTKLAVEALAVFHGSSYYALKRDPNLKKMFVTSTWDDPPNIVTSKLVENGCATLEKWLPTYGLSDDHVEKLKGLRSFIWENWHKITQKKDEHLLVLCHGDCWKNNLMFHKTADKTDQVCLLDFQFLNYNSFANDLQYFIFSSVQSDLIISDLDLILEFYYKRLKEIAPDIPDLTLERIRREFDEKYVMGIIMGLTFRPIIVSDTPFDVEDAIKGCGDERPNGFDNERFISDLKILLPHFEKFGNF